jgi:nucleoside-diphosphate-sugar epimerase
VQERGRGLDVVSLRLPAVYGPGDREMLALFDMMARGWLLLPAGIEQRVTLLHVEDAVSALRAAALATGPLGGTYEIGGHSQSGHTWREIAGKLGNILQRLVRCVPVPKFIMSGVGYLSAGLARLRGRPAMLTRSKVNELYHPDWVADGAAFREAADWQPRVDIEAGIAQTIAWYREAGWLAAPREPRD